MKIFKIIEINKHSYNYFFYLWYKFFNLNLTRSKNLKYSDILIYKYILHFPNNFITFIKS